MSETNGQPSPQPLSVVTKGPNATPPCPPVVTNAAQLVIAPTLTLNLHEQHLHALNIVQLEYARDVSAAAATAYEKLILAFRAPGGPPSDGRNES